jgi:hypothetical protein
MHERLGGDHAIKDLSTRIPRRLDNLTIRIGSGVVESQHGKRRQYRVQAGSANAGLRGVSIDASLKFDSADYFIPVAQMDGDVGIQ